MSIKSILGATTILAVISIASAVSGVYYRDAACTTLMPITFKYYSQSGGGLVTITNPYVSPPENVCVDDTQSSRYSDYYTCNSTTSVWINYGAKNCNVSSSIHYDYTPTNVCTYSFLDEKNASVYQKLVCGTFTYPSSKVISSSSSFIFYPFMIIVTIFTVLLF